MGGRQPHRCAPASASLRCAPRDERLTGKTEEISATVVDNPHRRCSALVSPLVITSHLVAPAPNHEERDKQNQHRSEDVSQEIRPLNRWRWNEIRPMLALQHEETNRKRQPDPAESRRCLNLVVTKPTADIRSNANHQTQRAPPCPASFEPPHASRRPRREEDGDCNGRDGNEETQHGANDQREPQEAAATGSRMQPGHNGCLLLAPRSG